MPPGLKFSISTSAVSSSRSSTSRPFSVAEVQRHAALVAVDAQEIAGRADLLVEGRAPVAHLVALRRLDLDDLGAVIGQPLRAERSAEDPRQVDDPDAVERAHPRSPLCDAVRPPAPDAAGEFGIEAAARAGAISPRMRASRAGGRGRGLGDLAQVEVEARRLAHALDRLAGMHAAAAGSARPPCRSRRPPCRSPARAARPAGARPAG